jgi:hypothetical protein
MLCTLFLKLGSHYYREPQSPAGRGATNTILEKAIAGTAIIVGDARICVSYTSYKKDAYDAGIILYTAYPSLLYITSIVFPIRWINNLPVSGE